MKICQVSIITNKMILSLIRATRNMSNLLI